MSSHLRSTATSAGYFVMSGETILDGSGYGVYDLCANAVYNNNGTVSTPARLQLDSSLAGEFFDGDDASMNTLTLKDLGSTIHDAAVYGAGGTPLQGRVDVRKVEVVDGGKHAAGRSVYVSLGTNLRNADPENYVSDVKPSVALVGKLL